MHYFRDAYINSPGSTAMETKFLSVGQQALDHSIPLVLVIILSDITFMTSVFSMWLL